MVILYPEDGSVLHSHRRKNVKSYLHNKLWKKWWNVNTFIVLPIAYNTGYYMVMACLYKPQDRQKAKKVQAIIFPQFLQCTSYYYYLQLTRDLNIISNYLMTSP
jgi:hypothetical protein